MKIKHISGLIVAGVFVLLIGLVTVGQTAAQTQGTDNLLVNPGFEAGHHRQDGIPEITVPDGWRLHWLDNAEFFGSDGPAARPESVVWFIGDAPLDEQSLFFRDGSFALKVFKGGRPMYSALSQDVGGLQAGRRYRLVAPVYIDIVASYSGGKQAPADLESGFVRLGAGPTGAAWLDESAIAYSGYWTAATVSPFYLSYPIFVYDFTATQENMTVWIEFGSRGVYPNSGFFLDTMGLYTLDGVDTSVSSGPANPAPVVSGPTATPFPTPTPRPDGAIIHTVQAGDTFWSIAIQYASALDMTAEQALPFIKELNGDPTFLNVGQEVVISLPGETSLAPETAPESGDTESADETVAGSGETEAEEIPTAEPTAVSEEPEGAAEPATVQQEQPEPETIANVTNSICVAAFNDENGDGAIDEGEGWLADAVFTISRPSGTVATYVSDGVNEPYCFGELEADTYQINFSQPPDFRLTTADNWAIAVSDGVKIPVQFGAQFDTTEVAAVPPEVVAGSDAQNTAGSGNESPESGGFGSQLRTVALGIAIVLVLLAGVGVLLLRRS